MIPPASHPNVNLAPNVPSSTFSPTLSTVVPGNLPVPISPTSSPALIVFTCTDIGVDIAQPPYIRTTTVSFRVAYLIESLGKPSDFISAVETMILETAVVGALQCVTGGLVFARGMKPPPVDFTTIMTSEQCMPVFAGSQCSVWETGFDVTVDENVDPTVATFLGYTFVQEEMKNGAFVGRIPILDRVEFLRPSPLLPPIAGIDGSPTTAPGLAAASSASPISVNHWTLGAVLTMCK
jgi:hypothetical protein